MATNRRETLVGSIIACVISIPFLAIGISVWTLSKDAAGMVIGAMFALGGLWGLCVAFAGAWWGKNCPKVVPACLWSLFLVILGSPFLYVGITRPEEIQGSISITMLDADVLHKGGLTLGGIVFILAGITCFGAIPFVWRGIMKRGLLEKVGNGEKKAEPGVGR